MIITAPTGLYEPVLPQSPGDSGNFTFTISGQQPPRSGESFVQLPLPEVVRKQPERVYSKQQKRVFLGELVYDITIPGPATTGNGSPLFEIGQVLEFDDISDEDADPYSLDKVELRQDLKVIDFKSVGLTEEEFRELRDTSERRLDEITKGISEIGSDINSNKEEIQANQAMINNSNSILKNIITVLGSDSTQAIKVRNNLDSLEQKKTELLENRKELQNKLNDLRAELRIVREVVR